MTIDVRALPLEIEIAAIDYDHSSGLVTPLIVLDFDTEAARHLTAFLAARGWSDPLPLLAGLGTHAGPLMSLRSNGAGAVMVEDAYGSIAEGPLQPSATWVERVQAHGHVGVVAGARVTTAPNWKSDLARRAHTDEVLGAIATTSQYTP